MPSSPPRSVMKTPVDQPSPPVSTWNKLRSIRRRRVIKKREARRLARIEGAEKEHGVVDAVGETVVEGFLEFIFSLLG